MINNGKDNNQDATWQLRRQHDCDCTCVCDGGRQASGAWFWWQWKWDFSVVKNNVAEMETNVGPTEGELFI